MSRKFLPVVLLSVLLSPSLLAQEKIPFGEGDIHVIPLSENAVRIQISVAIITYCLVAIVQHDMQLKRSTYEVLQILSISLTDKTHLRDLFDKTNFNDVKDLSTPLILGLFD